MFLAPLRAVQFNGQSRAEEGLIDQQEMEDTDKSNLRQRHQPIPLATENAAVANVGAPEEASSTETSGLTPVSTEDENQQELQGTIPSLKSNALTLTVTLKNRTIHRKETYLISEYGTALLLC
jgi:hypothetical protein